MKFQRIIRHKTIDSTQSAAKELDRTSPAIITADAQTGGKGRAGRKWFSPRGGIWVSFMIPHKEEKQLNHYITLVGAFTVIKFLEELDINGIVRWPNDIFVNDKKIAGILGEYNRGAIICGLGINVNIYEFPAWIGPATSLALELEKKLNINKLKERIFQLFENCFLNFEQNDGRTIVQLLRPYFVSSGDFVTVSYGKKKIAGVVQDIDEDGALVLRTETGALLKMFSGELRRVKWS